jgi:hypothetical protein
MMGSNVVSYSHYDEYLIDFTAWKPGKPPASAFTVPNACADATRSLAPAAGARAAPRPAAEGSRAAAPADAGAAAARLAQAGALMPWARLRPLGAAGGDAAARARPQGVAALEAEALLLRRLAARAEAAAFVARHDAEAAGYAVALNRFRCAPSAAPAAGSGQRQRATEAG